MSSIYNIIFVALFVFVVSKIIKSYDLLKSISDDIYDIKKKLRLPTAIRTSWQKERLEEETIKSYIYRDSDLPKAEEMDHDHKECGFTKKELKKYKTYIEITTNGRKTAKYCPGCDIFFDGVVSARWGLHGPGETKCDICKGDLVLAKDTWKCGKFILYDDKN